MAEFLMDFGIRDWLLILGPVLIAGVLIHGYWRMRINRNSLKMALDKSFMSKVGDREQSDHDFTMFRAELPNGGARVRSVDPESEAEQTSLNLDVEVPVLMEPVYPDNSPGPDNSPEPNNSPESVSSPGPVNSPELEQVDQSVIAESAKNNDAQISTSSDESSVQVASPAKDLTEKFIVVHVLGVNEPFHGQTLLESLVEQKMIFGAMDIFHRLSATGDSDFSLLNAVEPGTFDLNTIGDMKIPGVSLFMRVHELADPVSTFDCMIEVAQNLAHDLGGELKDETRSVMTSQTIEHCRLDIRQYQHKHR